MDTQDRKEVRVAKCEKWHERSLLEKREFLDVLEEFERRLNEYALSLGYRICCPYG